MGSHKRKHRLLWTCLYFLEVHMLHTDDGPKKGPNRVAMLWKSDRCIGGIFDFTDTILMFIYTVYEKTVLGIHLESNVASTDTECLLRMRSQ
jgi:hypothetical protein